MLTYLGTLQLQLSLDILEPTNKEKASIYPKGLTFSQHHVTWTARRQPGPRSGGEF